MSSKAASVGTSNGWSEFGISVLNGVVGDYLVRRGNGLAIPMAFVQDGRPLTLNAQALRTAQPACTGKLVVLIHGWCCNEDVWRFANDGTTYATKLQHDAGYTPFAVRYNSGMPIAKSGAAFDEQMTALVAAYPCAIDEIVLIGHSMGGLVIRSACEHGAHRAAAWLPLIRHAFYIGTPHDGADLERFAQGTTAALASTPNPVARLFGRLLDIRSIGVRDLHNGGTAALTPGETTLARIPWLPTARHHRLVGTLTDDPQHPISQTFGDGLVRVPTPSAGALPGATPPDVTVFAGVHHMQLAREPAIYAAILAVTTGA